MFFKILGHRIINEEAPDQNRTDTSSLEGYGSTIELQAHKKSDTIFNKWPIFFQGMSGQKQTSQMNQGTGN